MIKKMFAGLFCVYLINMVPVSFASDLDDGIKADDSISGYDSIKPDTNTAFIVVKSGGSGGKVSENGITMNKSGDIIQGSIILQPGAKAGDITLIFEGDNNTLVNTD